MFSVVSTPRERCVVRAAGEPFVLPNHRQLQASAPMNAQKGIDAAKEHLDIPALIAAEDMTSPNVDELRFGVNKTGHPLVSFA